jgi:hypothetical protein
MQQVNQELVNTVGMEADDMPDYDYYQAYEDGISVVVVARRAIRRAAVI